MVKQPDNICVDLPEWLNQFADSYKQTIDLSSRMKFVIAAAAMNVKERSGGPFAAGIFEIQTGKLIALGINLVTTQNLSILHAEIVAIALAQRVLGTYDLGATGLPAHELITSVEPCAMCYGAIPWSGIRHVATGALDEDARALGFDEGSKPADWVKELQTRDIEVTTCLERDAARQVILKYIQGGGHLYSSREN